MSVVQTALWFVEGNLQTPIALSAIAKACGLTPEHLGRVFAQTTGETPMAYARKRRLSEAAKRLVTQKGPITEIAFDFGYSSTEAFSRAFRAEFGLSPMQVRKAGHVTRLTLTEIFTMDQTLIVNVAEPRFEDRAAFSVTGFADRYTFETNFGIPQLWEKLGPHFGNIEGQTSPLGYGVCANFEENCSFEYVAGVATDPSASVEKGMRRIDIPAQHYAVFTHKDHVSTIRKTVYSIMNVWFPKSEYEGTGGPEFELYLEDFDGQTGIGTTEIWIPVKKKAA